MQDGDEVNIQELASNLTLYKDQLNQVSISFLSRVYLNPNNL